ncbi:uncharacterized protein E2C01_076493 [Portunus trituberculatus]|uniref:Uncharacterized protein n=1 Tax=Portunus trituberculatus TaxID=210409 RepID=A0A5B7IHX0_PORTR|nr:uncharacterized protein [Portunus trituberculatus]
MSLLIHSLLSISVLMEYLTHSSVSPLPKIFVEVDDPLASSVHHSCFENSVSTCYFGFYGVPKDKVNSVSPLLMDTLTKIGSGEMSIEMDTMKDILSNLILLQDSSLETIPHDTIANSAIGDILYGNSCQHVSPAAFWSPLVWGRGCCVILGCGTCPVGVLYDGAKGMCYFRVWGPTRVLQDGAGGAFYFVLGCGVLLEPFRMGLLCCFRVQHPTSVL